MLNNAKASTIPCPACRLADQTYKVSQIYLESSTRLEHDEFLNQPALDRLLEDMCPDLSDCSEQDHLVRQFARAFAPPPPGEARPSPRMHPDAAFAVFLLLLLVMLYQITVSQNNYLPYALGLFALGLLAYLLRRRQAIGQHRTQNQRAQETSHRAESAMRRWGKLYFCSRDHGVFHPDDNRLIPLEEIQPYLNER